MIITKIEVRIINYTNNDKRVRCSDNNNKNYDDKNSHDNRIKNNIFL